MYKIEKKKCFYVLDRDNNYQEFKCFRDLLLFLRSRRIVYRDLFFNQIVVYLIGHNWNDIYITKEVGGVPFYKTIKHNIKFIVFDAYHRIVPIKLIKQGIEELEYERDRYKSWRHRRVESNWLGFRNGPVSYTGYYYRRYNRGYKRPRTTQELKRNSWDIKYSRGKRRKKYLPCFWDDIPVSDRGRSWKNQKKKKQWMK